MLWACILLPQLAMDAALRGRADPEAPLALLGGPAQRRVIQALNPAARRLGLRPGQSLTAARALSDGFACAEYDGAEIQRCHDLLAAWAYGFSSQVSQHYPRALLLEVRSSLGLFGPWPRFEARLRAELDALGFRRRIALAPNPAAARVLANVGDGLAVAEPGALREVLGRLPLERCGLPKETLGSLARMGLRSLQQLLALPRDGLARRFPPTLLQHLDALLGQRALALDFYRPPEVFESRIELNFDVESTQALLFPLRRLTGDLAAFLAGRDSGVQRFDLHLEHHGRGDTRMPVGLLSAERDPAMLFELTRGRLEQLQLPAPVYAVRLRADELPAFAPEHRQLFDERPQQSLPWEQLRERLRARLGDDAVHGLSAVAEHRPELAWQPRDTPRPPYLAPCGARPGWLLAQPQVLRETSPKVLAGPERIESGWWDGGDLRRDYYVVETRSGQRAWVYREVGGKGPWLLHGWFA